MRTRLERKLALVQYEIKEAFNTKKNGAEKSIIQNIKSNPKVFYGYAKSHSAIRSDITMMRDERGQITGDYQKLANLLQNHFSSVYSDPESADKKDPDFPNHTGSPPTPECFKISDPLAAKNLCSWTRWHSLPTSDQLQQYPTDNHVGRILQPTNHS